MRKVLPITAALIVVLAATGVEAEHEARVPGKCAGLTVTISGTANGETINGTAGDDVIHGGGGNDTIWGHGGSDTICGGPGDDTIGGGAGNDFLYGNVPGIPSGTTKLYGNSGYD